MNDGGGGSLVSVLTNNNLSKKKASSKNKYVGFFKILSEENSCKSLKLQLYFPGLGFTVVDLMGFRDKM